MSLPNVIKMAIENRLAGVHVSLPAKIESYDPATQKANIKPLIKREYQDGTKESLPVINNVPVIWPGMTTGILSFPVKAGDTVLAVFSERSLDVWLSKGGEVEPNDRRKHDISDAIAIPGLFSFADVPGLADPSSAIFKFGDAQLSLNKDGKLALGNQAAELLDLFEQTLAAIEAMTTATSIGPQPPLNVAQFTAIKTTLANLKGSL